MRAILTYHSIDRSGSPISVAPETFQTHRTWLTSGRVRALSLDDIVMHADAGEDAVAVTFDDGFLNAREALQSLLSDGVPVAVFVVSGHVGGTNAWGGRTQPGIPTQPLLDWSDLEGLASRGAAIGAHTRTHRRLTGLSDAALDEELQGCADDLRGRLGARSAHVAYPYGDADRRVAARAARHFRYGHSTDFGLLGSQDPPMRGPRLDMFYFRAPGAIEAWGSSRFRQRLGWIRARRMVRKRIGRVWCW